MLGRCERRVPLASENLVVAKRLSGGLPQWPTAQLLPYGYGMGDLTELES